MWSQVDFNGRSIVTNSVSDWVGIHSVDVVVGEIHHDDLRISGLCSRNCISPDIFRSDLTVFGKEVALEASFVIVVGFPDHSFGFGVSVSEMPVGIIVNIEFSVGVFDDSVGIVHTWPDTQIDGAGSVGFFQVIESIINGLGELEHVSKSIGPWFAEACHCWCITSSQSLGNSDFGRGVAGETSKESSPGNVGEGDWTGFTWMIDSDCGEFGDGSMLFPVESSELDELSAFSGGTPPATNAAWSLEDFRDEVDSSESFVWKPWALSHSLELILPSFGSVLLGDEVVDVQKSLDKWNSSVSDVHSHPFGEHGDLSDVVGDVAGSPSEEILDHDLELLLHEGTVSQAHFVSSALHRHDVELPAVVI